MSIPLKFPKPYKKPCVSFFPSFIFLNPDYIILLCFVPEFASLLHRMFCVEVFKRVASLFLKTWVILSPAEGILAL